MIDGRSGKMIEGKFADKKGKRDRDRGGKVGE